MVIVTIKKGVEWINELWLLLGAINLICGGIILFNPFASSISIVMLGGIIIMVHSVICIVDMIMIRKDAKEVAKALKDAYKEYQTTKKLSVWLHKKRPARVAGFCCWNIELPMRRSEWKYNHHR